MTRPDDEAEEPRPRDDLVVEVLRAAGRPPAGPDEHRPRSHRLTFSRRFVAPIRAGEKSQTIRARRKGHPIGPGDALVIEAWDGVPYRSGSRRYRVIPPVVCASVEPVALEVEFSDHFRDAAATFRAAVAGRELLGDELEGFARADGFPCAAEMALHWIDLSGLRGGRDPKVKVPPNQSLYRTKRAGLYRFEGVLVRWKGVSP